MHSRFLFQIRLFFSFRKLLILPLFFFLFSGFSASAESVSFIFSSDLPTEQKQFVLLDLEALNSLQLRDKEGKGARLFGAPLNVENLKTWLAERSHYMVSDRFNYSTSVKVISPNFNYANPTLLPYKEVTPKPRKDNDNSSKVVTVMTNMGAHIYVQGKKAKNLLTADLEGIGTVTINSPRIGLFKIGEGLFKPLLKNSSDNLSSFANSLRRLAVYFHEARHSDGNGKSLGFLHAPCPESKGAYAGSYACDRNQNGPYTIEAVFLRSAVDNCAHCNRREKEALRNIYADKFNRVLTVGTVTNHEQQAAITDSTEKTCNTLKSMNVTTETLEACRSRLNSSQSALPVTAPESRPAWLDERPERSPL